MDRSNYKPPSRIEAVPVLTTAATLLFEALVKDATVWEFGSGGSTLWLAERAASVISVEDDVDWHKKITAALKRKKLDNAEVRLTTTALLPDEINAAELFDVVFVDCLTQNERRRSVILGAQHVKPGGWLVADDYDFPLTHKAVEGLRAAGWDVAIVGGRKVHPVKMTVVKTATAFCHKPEEK